jgi:MoxR-like ATPase
MTDASTSDESSTDEQDPHRTELTKAVLRELQNVFEDNFGGEFEEASFRIGQEDEEKTDSEGPWTIRLQGASNKRNESTSAEKGKHEVFLQPGDKKIHLKVEGNAEQGEIEIHIKAGGAGRWAKFSLLRIPPIDSEEYEDGFMKIKELNNNTYPKYKNRNFSRNVLEVWFPSDKEDDGVLKIPVGIESYSGLDKLPDNWGEFSDDGLKVHIPDIEAKRIEDGYDVRVGSNEEWRSVALSFLTYWVVCNIYARNGTLREGDDNRIPNGFPDLSEYRAKRPVNLKPDSVLEALENDGLYFPWHVVESACSALNAGKNVIFTGPPGGGKSKLAAFLAEKATGQDPLLTTASPAWSTGDLIGRYMPNRNGNGLVFKEGVFLRALGDTDERSRWLVIDEFNRADIDACFGELFSVLAGDAVELPFEKEVEQEDADEEETGELHPVRIAPESQTTETEFDYLVPDTFRLIGTMNDADRSGLNNLSFALMRRFAIIPVEPPREDDVKEIIAEEIKKTTSDLKLELSSWDVNQNGKTRCSLGLIEEELNNLFAQSEKLKEDKKIGNLISNSVVGISVIGDVIRFVGEGIRTETEEEKESLQRSDELDNESPWDDMRDLARRLTLSYLALATVLQIFPQLEALGMGSQQEENKLSQAIQHIFEAFYSRKNYDGENLKMLRVKREDGDYILDSEGTIAQFLFRNLKNRFPQQAEDWRSDLAEYFPSDGGSDNDEDA